MVEVHVKKFHKFMSNHEKFPKNQFILYKKEKYKIFWKCIKFWNMLENDQEIVKIPENHDFIPGLSIFSTNSP